MILTLLTCTISAQTTTVLNPDQDARISRKPADLSVANTNYGNYQGLNAYAWSTNFEPVYYRGLIKFDLSNVPTGSTINNATLSLFHDPISPQGPHESLTGTNTCFLQRIISAWDETFVTWNTQPSVTTINQVNIPQSTSPTQDFPNIDVSQLVQDMIDNPQNSHGFLLRLITEVEYRKMIFASSNHPDTTKHPKLTINYTIPTSINEPELESNNISVFPNPILDYSTIYINSNNQNSFHTISLINSYGQIVRQFNTPENEIRFLKNDLANGIYFLRITSGENSIEHKKIIIN